MQERTAMYVTNAIIFWSTKLQFNHCKRYDWLDSILKIEYSHAPALLGIRKRKIKWSHNLGGVSKCWWLLTYSTRIGFLTGMCILVSASRISFISILLLSISCHHLQNDVLMMKAKENIKSIWLANCLFVSNRSMRHGEFHNNSKHVQMWCFWCCCSSICSLTNTTSMCVQKKNNHKRGRKKQQTTAWIAVHFQPLFTLHDSSYFHLFIHFHSTYFLNAFLLMCSIYTSIRHVQTQKIVVSLSLAPCHFWLSFKMF